MASHDDRDTAPAIRFGKVVSSTSGKGFHGHGDKIGGIVCGNFFELVVIEAHFYMLRGSGGKHAHNERFERVARTIIPDIGAQERNFAQPHSRAISGHTVPQETRSEQLLP